MAIMSMSAAHASAFFEEALRAGSVWTVRDGGGYPAPLNGTGVRSQPFWSLRSRAERVVSAVPAYGGFEIDEIDLEAFRSRWLPGLQADGVLVGLNWSGESATGYDISAPEVAARLGD